MNPEPDVISLGDTFDINGTIWVWESIRPGVEVTLRRDGTDDDWLVMSMQAFIAMAGKASRAGRVELRPDGDDWPTDVRDMESHLKEVFLGIPMNPLAAGPRPQFDSSKTTLEQRLTAKLEELDGTSLARSRSSLFLNWKAYQDSGPAGLNARMHRKGQKRLQVSKADPRLIEVIDKVLKKRTALSTTTRRHCSMLVRKALEKLYPGDPICDIKHNTLQGYINERDAGRYTFDKSSTRRTAANSPDRQYNSGNSFKLGAVCEIDSTKLDVLVWDDQGNEFRPSLTVLFDVASRVPLAWAIHAEEPNAFDHALLLARAIVGRRAVPGSRAAVLSASSTLPVELMRTVNPLLSDDSLAVPWIFPRAITIDGGADFRSPTFEAACRAFGIDIVLAPPNAATVKPHVERNFRTASSDFASWLDGAVGNSVTHRGKYDDPVLPLDSVRLLFDSWLTTVYLNKPHGGLESPFMPGRHWTPNQMYAALFEVDPGVQIPFGKDEYFSLLPTRKRIIGKRGIELDNRTYDSVELHDLRNRSLTGAAAGTRRARQFDISYDPYNLNVVWVRHPETRVWIECWDTALEQKTAWMAAETAVRLVERFGDGSSTDQPKQKEWLDEVESRGRRGKRARNNHRTAVAPSADSIDKKTLPTRHSPVELRRWAKPTETEEIDWDAPEHDIVTMMEMNL